MTEKIVLSQISIEELTDLIEKATERSVHKALNLSREKDDDVLLTTQQVCEDFKVSRITLNNYRKSGKLIPVSKAGKQHAYRKGDCRRAFIHKISKD